MLLWLVFCAEIMLALEEMYGDLRFYSRTHQSSHAWLQILSLDVSQCAGGIDQTNRNTHTHTYKTNACGFFGICKVFGFGGASDLQYTMNLSQPNIKFCCASRSDSRPISKASDAMTCEHAFALRCLEAVL